MYILVDITNNKLCGVYPEPYDLFDELNLVEFEILLENETEKHTAYNLTLHDLYVITSEYYLLYKEQLKVASFVQTRMTLE